jgi:prolyl-tRNA synthetase
MSQLFTKTTKTVPADEQAKNAQLLIKAGYIHKEMAGVYAYMPLGIRVLENIKQIVREEMDAIGGQEMIMTNLQRKELWEKTDRWDDKKVDIWFKTKLQNGSELGLAWSHEEPITDMMRNYVSSYRDLPAYPYQFQTKLRNELRSKSGIMRGREFLMKDMYSYSVSEEAHQKFYDETIKAYMRVFDRVGLGGSTFLTFASGGAFTQFSHEFQTLTETGEDTIYLHRGKKMAINEEVLTDDVMSQLGVKREELEETKAAEVGNIFSFGPQKSEQLDLYFVDEDGSRKPVILGSYGIGVTRLMGVLVEHFADERGIVWPENVAPFKVIIVRLGDDKKVVAAADKLYEYLTHAHIGVLYDNRSNTRPGEKFADADLMGIPYRIVVSGKTLASKEQYEVKKRTEEAATMCSLDSVIEVVA